MNIAASVSYQYSVYPTVKQSAMTATLFDRTAKENRDSQAVFRRVKCSQTRQGLPCLDVEARR